MRMQDKQLNKVLDGFLLRWHHCACFIGVCTVVGGDLPSFEPSNSVGQALLCKTGRVFLEMFQ